MKKLLFIAFVALSFVSCNSRWEYQTVVVEGSSSSSYSSRSFSMEDSQLNEMGSQGWELVDVYTMTETIHPNFGNSSYVTGLQPNVRTSEVAFVFKRPKK